jgi:TonB family protein
VGLTRLGGYRRRGRAIPSDLRPAGARAGAALLLSGDVPSPVTFGWRKPVILLPAGFPSLAPEMREAILRHELLHVKRRDWLFTIAEELLRALLWFHPAVWWVIGEIQLAREQTVDRAVIETTCAREPYLDALLLMAGVSLPGSLGQMDLAPAPMFLRRRHLKRRLIEVMKEAQMTTISKTRFVCMLSAAVALVAGVSWIAAGAFPLSAAPQTVADAAGVAVNVNGAQLIHRSPVSYPAEALAKGVGGTVVVQTRLDTNGEVVEATVLSGPDELRRAAQESALTWHFAKSEASTTRLINIDFSASAALKSSAVTPPPAPFAEAMSGDNPPPPPPPPPPPASGRIARIDVQGLSDSARDELLSRLPIQAGSHWSRSDLDEVRASVKSFDSHLAAVFSLSGDDLVVTIGPGLTPMSVAVARSSGKPTTILVPPPPPAASEALAADVHRIGNGVTAPTILSRVEPAYPKEPGSEKVNGAVVVSCVVGADGKATEIQVVKSLAPAFDAKAIDAVSQWVFKPGTLNGVPVKVRINIEVNFQML